MMQFNTVPIPSNGAAPSNFIFRATEAGNDKQLATDKPAKAIDNNAPAQNALAAFPDVGEINAFLTRNKEAIMVGLVSGSMLWLITRYLGR